MKKANLVLLLVVVVAAVFLLRPDLLGSGGDAPSLSVAPATGDEVRIPTDVSCTEVQDCVDYALTQDPDAGDVRAVCDGTCTFITEKTAVEVEQ